MYPPFDDESPPTSGPSILVVPGSSPKMTAKALTTPVDEVVFDLEDAVSPGQKGVARRHVAEVLASSAASRSFATLSVRINGSGTAWFDGDLDMLAHAGSPLNSVVIPKAESTADVDRVRLRLRNDSVALQALLETPRGIENAANICSATGVAAVVLGYADLAAALGRSRKLDSSRWIAIQDRVLIAARSAGVAAVDGPYLGIRDDAEFREATRWAREMGFDGKWVIHPDQIAGVRDIFTPDASEVDDAKRILEALDEARSSGNGAVQLDGRMLDEALALSARRVVDLARRREML